MAETKVDGQIDSQPAPAATPGAVISPGATPPPTPAEPVAAAPQSAPVEPTQTPEPTQPAGGFYNPGPGSETGSDQLPMAGQDGLEPVSWTASEFVAHEKNAGWYLGLIVASAVVAGLIYVITRDTMTSIVVLVAGLVLTGYGARKPKEIEYHLDDSGITVAGKHFLYETFKSFSVIPEGAFSSIVFMPMRRFALPLTLYYAPGDEDKIVNILTDRLPLEERRPDVVDSLMRRIRF